MRTQYESDEDRFNEQKVMSKVRRHWRLDGYRKLPKSYVVDFALIRKNEVIGFAEVKRRNVAFNKYPSIFISMHKIKAANDMNKLGFHTALIVECNDATGYLLLNDPPCKVTFGGRSDRGDHDDQEPMAHFSTDRVRLL